MNTTRPAQINYDRPMRIALIVGIVAAIVSIAGLFISGPGLFFQAYLYSFMFYLGIALGLLGFLMLFYTVSAKWGLTIRRVAEAGGSTLWLMAVLFIPVIIGLPFLFPWARPAEVAANPTMQYQQWYLNVPFFIIRAVIFFAIWILLSVIANRRSQRIMNAPGGDRTLAGGMQTFGAVGSILYLFTMFYASVDWLMSLQPDWRSTAFGLVIVLAQVMTALAFSLVVLNVVPGLALGRTWNYKTTPVPYQDLGALAITLVMAWAYVSFFQMLIVWAGNIPREVVWYVDRLAGGWNIIAILIALFQFAIPFMLLLTIRVRHNLRTLAILGGLLLFTHLVNVFWHVKPAFYPNGFAISWLDIVVPVAMGGLWLAAFFYSLQRRPALPESDLAILSTSAETEEEAAGI